MKYYGIFMITEKGKKITDFFTCPEGESVSACARRVIEKHNERLKDDSVHRVMHRQIEKLDADLILCTWEEKEAEVLAIEANIITKEEANTLTKEELLQL